MIWSFWLIFKRLRKRKKLLYLALLYFNWWIKQNWINSYLGFAIRGILRNFATKNIAKGREGIVHGLIVNGLVEIFDKNISNTRSTKARDRILCFKFSLNPLGFSFTRETDTKVTRSKSWATWKLQFSSQRMIKTPISPNYQVPNGYFDISYLGLLIHSMAKINLNNSK